MYAVYGGSAKQICGFAYFLLGGHTTCEADGFDLVGTHVSYTIITGLSLTKDLEREIRFMSTLQSDWLGDVMVNDHSSGTYEWVLSSSVFQTWLSGSENTLWIQGNQGAGKTTLAKFLFQQLRRVFADDSVSPSGHRPQWTSNASEIFSGIRHVLACFLSANSSQQSNGIGVLQSLLYQIISIDRKLFRYIYGKTVFSRPERGGFRQYMGLLSAILRDPSLRGTIIVLDALDECGSTSREKIVELLSNLANESSIQLLITSRPMRRLESRLMLDLGESTEYFEMDIKTYVVTAVRELAIARGLSDDMRNLITRTILSHSHEGFIWVQLVLQSISKASTARMFRDKLKHLPKTLHDAYFGLLNGIIGSIDTNVRRALYFVAVTGAPLQVKVLSTLLALSHCWDLVNQSTEESFTKQTKSSSIGITPNLDDITDNQIINFERDFEQRFHPFLRLTQSSITLAHDSLWDVLKVPSEVDKFHATFNLHPLENICENDLRQVHGVMAVLCLQYMLAAFQGQDDPLSFLPFSCSHWMEHAREAGSSQSFRLEYLVRMLFSKAQYISSWVSTVADSEVSHVTLVPLNADITFVLTAFDLGNLFGRMLDISVDALLSTDQEGRTPLHFAAANNALKSTEWIQDVLIAKGRGFGDMATRKDTKGESRVSLAARNGHEKLVKLLLLSLENKCDFDPRPFRTAAESENVRIFEILYNTNIETADQGMSLLIDAAALNSVNLMKK